MSLQWQEVTPEEFEQYPTNFKQRQPDDLDDVMAALQSGKVVRITVDDEKAIRGRRMALGRRAKQRGFPIEMRYQANTIVIRKASGEGGAQSEPAEEEAVRTDDEVAQEVTKRSRRGSRAAQTPSA